MRRNVRQMFFERKVRRVPDLGIQRVRGTEILQRFNEMPSLLGIPSKRDLQRGEWGINSGRAFKPVESTYP